MVQCHKEVLKFALVYDTSVADQYSTKVVIAVASIMGFHLFSTDAIKPHIQNSKPPKKAIYVRPCNGFGSDLNEILKFWNRYMDWQKVKTTQAQPLSHILWLTFA